MEHVCREVAEVLLPLLCGDRTDLKNLMSASTAVCDYFDDVVSCIAYPEVESEEDLQMLMNDAGSRFTNAKKVFLSIGPSSGAAASFKASSFPSIKDLHLTARMLNDVDLDAVVTHFHPRVLRSMCLKSCKLPLQMHAYTALTSLELWGVACVPELSIVSGCKALQRLVVMHSPSLKRVGQLGLSALEVLCVGGCDNLTSVDGLQECSPSISPLDSVTLEDCDKLRSLQGIYCCTTIHMAGCNDISNLRGLYDCTLLKEMDIYGCEGLESLEGLEGCTSMAKLVIAWCGDLTRLVSLPSLEQASLSNCRSLRSMDGLQGSTRLTRLDLVHCNSVSTLTGLEGCTSLLRLDIRNCSILKDLVGLDSLVTLELMHVSCCPQLPLHRGNGDCPQLSP